MKKLLLVLVCALLLVGCGAKGDPLTAEKGDIVKIDYAGYMDGKAFDGGSADDQIVKIGAGNYIPGFEDGLVGMKEGEKKDVEVTFPDNYTEELKGKAATFKMTLDKVYKAAEGKAKKGQVADCDFDVSFEGLDGSTKIQSQLIVIGAGQYLPDIEKAVETLSVGESKEVVVEYPDDEVYGVYAGIKATFKITLKGLYE